VPVDQDHVPSALLQVQGGADANHACAQYENIGLQFRHRALRKLNVKRLRSMATMKPDFAA
jgi:hypothetical protein